MLRTGRERRSSPSRPGLSLFFGVAACSTGAIFARLADAPPFLAAAFRCGIAAIVLGLVAAPKLRKELGAFQPRQWAGLALAGVLLGLHFATWLWSLTMTNVASSAVLVSTSPFWAALLAPLVSHDRAGRWTKIGGLVAFSGTCVIAAAAHSSNQASLQGDLLALLGGLLLAAYLLAGRSLRQSLSLPVYASACYGAAAISLVLIRLVIPGALAVGGVSSSSWGWLLMLALVPQLIGHTLLNHALNEVSAHTVALAMLGEPIGAAALAWVFLGERVGLQTLLGAALVCTGLAMVSKLESTP